MGVNLKEGYNGDLTSREAGSVGGQMVKKMTPVRNMNFTRKNRNIESHQLEIRYIVGVSI